MKDDAVAHTNTLQSEVVKAVVSGPVTIQDVIVQGATTIERERCMRIAAYEAEYWRQVGIVDIERPHMNGICIGGIGAAANVCAAIATGQAAKPKTVPNIEDQPDIRLSLGERIG